MIRISRARNAAASRLANQFVRQSLRAGFAIAVLALVMFPVQMRAGAAVSHPHSIFQLLLDEEDGQLDHHADEYPPALGDAAPEHHDTVLPDLPDIPSVGPSEGSAEGFALLLASASVLILTPAKSSGVQFLAQSWLNYVPAIEPPPPRPAAI